MQEAALEAAEIEERTGERGRDREAHHEMAASGFGDGLAPLVERSLLRVWGADVRRQDDLLGTGRADDLPRQNEGAPALVLIHPVERAMIANSLASAARRNWARANNARVTRLSHQQIRASH